MTEFTTWRSLVDGEVIAAIPDNGVLLDDFANGPTVSSSEITDRKDFTELEYQEDEPEESEFGPVESRPDWVVQQGTPSIDNDEITLNGDIISNDPADNYSAITWEFEMDLPSNAALEVWAFSDNPSDPRAGNGYYIAHDTGSADAIELRKRDNGSITTLVSGGSSTTNPVTIKAEVDASGNWELFRDGESQGTATDNDHLDKGHVVASEERSTNSIIRFLEVY